MINIKEDSEFDSEIFDKVTLTSDNLIGYKFYNCIFENCDFTETSFRGSRFVDCNFFSCNLSMIDIDETTFSFVKFSDCKLIGINFASAVLRNPKYNCPISLYNCTLNHSTFMGLDLKGIIMQECFARDVDFREANLSKGNFQHTNFKESLFGNTNLSYANFSHAKNYMIDVSSNNISKAKFMMPEAMSFLYCLDIDLVE